MQVTPGFNKSGWIEPLSGIKITATHAEHSSVYVWRNDVTNTAQSWSGGGVLSGFSL